LPREVPFIVVWPPRHGFGFFFSLLLRIWPFAMASSGRLDGVDSSVDAADQPICPALRQWNAARSKSLGGMCTRQDKNKKKSAAIPSPFASMQSQSKPGANPYGKKT
jgi:anti-sigma factor ChrR (cupin superfamily)